MSIEIGSHKLPDFGPLAQAFGAGIQDYPPMDTLPDEYQSERAEGCKIAQSLFFNGGSLSDHGRKLKDGVDGREFYAALRSLLASFEPKHEHKIAACGLLIDEHTEAAQ